MKQMKVKAGFAAPAFFIYTLLLVVPIIIAFGLSFVNWNGIGEMKYIGLKNYMMVFKDKSIRNAVFNTLVITLAQTLVCNVLGLFLAVLLNKTGKKTAVFRTIYFLPNVLSGVAIAFVWKAIFSYNGVYHSCRSRSGSSGRGLHVHAHERAGMHHHRRHLELSRLLHDDLYFCAAIRTAGAV